MTGVLGEVAQHLYVERPHLTLPSSVHGRVERQMSHLLARGVAPSPVDIVCLLVRMTSACPDGRGVGHHGGVDTVAIDTDTIRLGQLLQLAGLADSGSDAKMLLAGGEVTVNGETEIRRGRTLRIGDEVRFDTAAVRVVARVEALE